MKHYGLIGKTLSHSWSQRWFEDMFEREGITHAQYRLYELPSVAHLRQWVSDNQLNGFNVTLPYKEEVIPHLDAVDEVAAAVGAVNCVEVQGDRLIGHNTDAPAFLSTLVPLLQPYHTSALILGTGGASKAVAYALHQLGIAYQFVSRHPQLHPQALSYRQAADIAATHLIIINATPVGMSPNVEGTPWQHPAQLGARHLCYDLIYNPEATRFLQESAAQGAQTCGGLAMLQRQAQLSWDIWSNA
ncbi:MAG: shikimate dehydrogenase [Bacteroidales bacterium]|nr:shikimate dehydrogenase [Bacteroidales bacterium]